MTKTFAFAFAGLASLATPVFAQSTPPTKLVVIDKVAIMQGSKVGQDVARQVQAIAKQAQTDLSAQGRSIQEEERTAVQQTAILSPDAKAKRMAGIDAEAAEVEARVTEFEKGRAEREAKLQAELDAREAASAEAEPLPEPK